MALLLALLLPLVSVSAYDGELFTADYYRWFYRWHRGGAWLPHQEYHECWGPNQCDFVPQNESSVALSVNSTLAPHLSSVEITFTFINDGEIHATDLVAAYLVDAEQQDATDDLIDYVPANQSSNLELGHAVTVGPLVNMRASFQFRYLRKVAGDKPTYAVLGESPFVEMERGHTEPLQVRLALTENSGEMRVMWVSGKVFGPNVRFGTASGVLERRAEATTVTYDADDMCSPRATTRSSIYFRHPGYIHEAVMTSLVPGQRYVYRVGSETGVTSPEFEFTFPVALDSDAGAQRPQGFFVFGDLGTGVLEKPADAIAVDDDSPERHFTSLDMVSRLAPWNDRRTVMQRIQQDLDEASDDSAESDAPEYAALIHIGDISYAKGSTYLWDQFGALVQPVATRLPYMVGIGNHEYDYVVNGAGHDLSGSEAALSNGWHPEGGNFDDDSHGECGVPFARRFRMPKGVDESSNPPFWYSFRVGLTHHIVLSSEHRCTSGAPMRAWLEEELRERVNRQLTPWLIVHLHRPLYCSESYDGDHNVAKLLRGCLEDLLAANHVDLVFSGHYHAYERTCAVFRGQCYERNGSAAAPTHIMVGSGGAELDDATYFQANWTRTRQQEYGHGRFHVFNASHAHFEFVRARDRVVSDAVWIVSSHDWNVTAEEY